MQKLSGRKTYTPTDAPQVRSNCGSVIKHHCEVGEVLQGLKTPFNNSDVDFPQHGGGSGLRVQNIVYVLNMRGKPLMPTFQQKAKRLVRSGKARVVKRSPFTIQLKYATGEAKQKIVLGIDSGYGTVGFSAVSRQRELASGVLTLRGDIPKLMEQRHGYRRGRRNKLWHRPPRFDNRGRGDGWLAPSIHHKLASHYRLVEQLKRILPVSEVVVEVASFDVQKIKHPEIEGKEYQEGDMLGFWNVREYVLHRDGHTCQHCSGKKKDKVLQTHHINGKKEGATNRPEELLTVCKTCHDEHHEGTDIIEEKPIKQFKAETFMTMVHWKLTEMLDCQHTFGYITKNKRIEHGLEKSHVNDAFVIAGGDTSQTRCTPRSVKQVRRNNRSLQTNRKGFKPSIRRKKYPLSPNDLVRFDGKEHRVKGVHSYGSRVVLDNKQSVAIGKIEVITYGKGMCYA